MTRVKVVGLGANQLRALAWLHIIGGAWHPAEVIRMSGCGPQQGWGALARLLERGFIVREDDEHVRITRAGVDALTSQAPVITFTRQSVRPDGRPLWGYGPLGHELGNRARPR